MGIPIYKQQSTQKKWDLASVGSLAGGIVGAVGGGGAGAIQGAQTGGAIGGMAQGLTKQDVPAQPLPQGGGAMQRRQAMQQQQSQLAQLEQGIQTLPTMPPEQRKQYEPQLLDAYSYLKSQNKGYA